MEGREHSPRHHPIEVGQMDLSGVWNTTWMIPIVIFLKRDCMPSFSLAY